MSKLLRWSRNKAKLLADWLWQQADGRYQALRASAEAALLVWQGRVRETPQTLKNNQRCALRASKAGRLKPLRPGFFTPPAGPPICVAGLHWLGLLVLRPSGLPSVAALHCWRRPDGRQIT